MARELLPFYGPAQVQLLMERIGAAAKTPREARIFSSTIRRAREELLELEALYAELPGVLEGEHGATERFRGILAGAFDAGIGGPSGTPETVGAIGAVVPFTPTRHSPRARSW